VNRNRLRRSWTGNRFEAVRPNFSWGLGRTYWRQVPGIGDKSIGLLSWTKGRTSLNSKSSNKFLRPREIARFGEMLRSMMDREFNFFGDQVWTNRVGLRPLRIQVNEPRTIEQNVAHTVDHDGIPSDAIQLRMSRAISRLTGERRVSLRFCASCRQASLTVGCAEGPSRGRSHRSWLTDAFGKGSADM